MKEMMTVVMAMSLRATRVVRIFRFSEPTEALFASTPQSSCTLSSSWATLWGQKTGKLMESDGRQQ